VPSVSALLPNCPKFTHDQATKVCLSFNVNFGVYSDIFLPKGRHLHSLGKDGQKMIAFLKPSGLMMSSIHQLGVLHI
jgi:hypothetical protein